MDQPVSVIIPAFNEQAGIGEVLDALQQMMASENISGEILIIDDGSKDKTAEIVRSRGVRLVQHDTNRGYGATLKTGILNAKHDLILITDADGTYPVEAIPLLLSRMDRCDMVVGARTGENVKIPFFRRPAKWFLQKLANYLAQKDIPDLNSGLRVFRRELAERFFSLFPEGFSFTITITMAALTSNYRVEFVPINYYRRKGKSTIRPARDFLGFLSLIVRMTVYFNPLRVFLPASLILFVIGVAKLAIDFFRLEHFGVGAAIAVVTAFQILCLGLLADLVIRRTRL
ncbi:MAG TPA: glycosyltransferase family 2 protein [Pyrinomonadaceae bacterium]|nr:glycosyltransferase family 2 protein [Pyrinomonadaceae bacterium]